MSLTHYFFPSIKSFFLSISSLKAHDLNEKIRINCVNMSHILKKTHQTITIHFPKPRLQTVRLFSEAPNLLGTWRSRRTWLSLTEQVNAEPSCACSRRHASCTLQGTTALEAAALTLKDNQKERVKRLEVKPLSHLLRPALLPSPADCRAVCQVLPSA